MNSFKNANSIKKVIFLVQIFEEMSIFKKNGAQFIEIRSRV
jgi:hypothetical protein